MNYQEYREIKQKEVNELPLHFAFGQKQLDEKLKELNCTIDDVYGLGYAGAFYLKKDAPIIRAYFSKEDQLPELMKDHDFAVDAFYYEMANHEYHINWQGDWDVCSCFTGKEPKYGEEKTYVDYLTEAGHSEWIDAYREAKRKFLKMADENDWY